MTDREFEKLLKAQDAQEKEKALKKGRQEMKSQLSSKSKRDRKGRKSYGRGGSSSESETEVINRVQFLIRSQSKIICDLLLESCSL